MVVINDCNGNLILENDINPLIVKEFKNWIGLSWVSKLAIEKPSLNSEEHLFQVEIIELIEK
jgi:hypothetical protein